MRVTTEMQAAVDSKIRECIEIANEHYGRTFKFPNVIYRKRGTTAGTANDATYTINLNAVLLIENGQTFIDRTVVHEFAHLVDGIVNPHTREGGMTVTRTGRVRRAKRDVHGRSWQNIMRLFGAEPSRCHTYDTSNSKVQKSNNATKYEWTCGCGGGVATMGSKRHQRMVALNGRFVYMRGHTPARCGNYKHTATIVRGVRQPTDVGFVREALPLAADAPAPAPKDPTFNRAPKLAGNKLEKCTLLYRENYGVSRKVMINLFVEEAGCTKAGAGTYYAKIKKELGG